MIDSDDRRCQKAAHQVVEPLLAEPEHVAVAVDSQELPNVAVAQQALEDVARRLVEADGETLNVILISTHAESDFVDLIEDAPVAGFVPKSELSRSAIGRLVKSAL